MLLHLHERIWNTTYLTLCLYLMGRDIKHISVGLVRMLLHFDERIRNTTYSTLCLYLTGRDIKHNLLPTWKSFLCPCICFPTSSQTRVQEAGKRFLRSGYWYFVCHDVWWEERQSPSTWMGFFLLVLPVTWFFLQSFLCTCGIELDSFHLFFHDTLITGSVKNIVASTLSISCRISNTISIRIQWQKPRKNHLVGGVR